jgi:hypothetical protein
MRLVTKPVVYMSKAIKYHRLGAFIYGFLCGSGLITFICGLAAIVMLPSLNLMINSGLTVIGALLFACGSCCEAYLRGSLAVPSKRYMQQARNQPKRANGISTQIIETPAELEEQKTHAS